MKNFTNDWKVFLSDKKNSLSFFLALSWVVALLFSFGPFFNMIEHRHGTRLNDFILSKIPVYDLSWVIFSIMYFVVFAGFFYALTIPKLLSKALLAYAILTTLRLITIYLVNLDPPAGIIPLKDPFFALVLAPKEIVNKDLFFSGHTSTVFLFAFMIPHSLLKKIFYAFCILIPAMVLVQHVHYTIDVVLAPFFSYYAYKIAFYKKENTEKINSIN